MNAFTNFVVLAVVLSAHAAIPELDPAVSAWSFGGLAVVMAAFLVGKEWRRWQ